MSTPQSSAATNTLLFPPGARPLPLPVIKPGSQLDIDASSSNGRELVYVAVPVGLKTVVDQIIAQHEVELGKAQPSFL